MTTMTINNFIEAFEAREDLKRYNEDALMLFALEMRFAIEDIHLVASNSLTKTNDDKKADMIFIDEERSIAIIAQAFISSDLTKPAAKANKASDLNTAASWILSREINDLPIELQTHAQELRKLIQENKIDYLYFWYVHNLPESENVAQELKTVQQTAFNAVKSINQTCRIQINAMEVGRNILEEWYASISTPILISDTITLDILGGFEILETDWKAYVTTISAKWLYEIYQTYKTKLFSANIRDYLGSRSVDKNINNGIKETASNNPNNFCIYNNGITALVHDFNRLPDDKLEITGISVVNGAQTTGALGSLETEPSDRIKIQIRFIKCNNKSIISEVVKFNNSQNKIDAPDFRSNDRIQRRLIQEFSQIRGVEYVSRRGGVEDRIRRKINVIYSITAGQAIAGLLEKPGVAYHSKNNIWEKDDLYAQIFNDNASAENIIFAWTLLKTVEKLKFDLFTKNHEKTIIQPELEQLNFLRNRGAIFLILSAVSKCLDIILNKNITSKFSLKFKRFSSLDECINDWLPIVNIACSFTSPLSEALADGIKSESSVIRALNMFQSFMMSTRQSNNTLFSSFADKINGG